MLKLRSMSSWLSLGEILGFAAMLSICNAYVADAYAQEYPIRQVTMVVPWAPGGPSDRAARIIATTLSQAFRQPVLVLNRGGQLGVTGAAGVAGAPPDGYTLLNTNIQSLTVSPYMLPSTPFEVTNAFAGVIAFGYVPYVLVASPTISANSVEEFLALAKGERGGLKFGSPGNGFPGQLAGEMLRRKLGANMSIITISGGEPRLLEAVRSGGVSGSLVSLPIAAPFIRDQRVKLLAIASPLPLSSFPGVPTLAEKGLGEIGFANWLGLLAPAGTPPDVIGKLNKTIALSMETTGIAQRLKELGIEPQASTPDEFNKLLAAYSQRWGKLIREQNIRAD